MKDVDEDTTWRTSLSPSSDPDGDSGDMRFLFSGIDPSVVGVAAALRLFRSSAAAVETTSGQEAAFLAILSAAAAAAAAAGSVNGNLAVEVVIVADMVGVLETAELSALLLLLLFRARSP